MALTEKGIQNAKPRDKEYKLYDANGLLLKVKPNGTKAWQFKFRCLRNGRRVEKSLSLGLWDEVSLKEAREKCIEAKRAVADNKDPAALKQQQKAIAVENSNNSFQAVAEEWHKLSAPRWKPGYAAKLWRRLELHILPAIGQKPIAEIGALEVINLIKQLEGDKKTETTHKIFQDCRAVFQHAFLHQKVQFNPLNGIRGILQPHVTTSHPTLSANQLPDFLARLRTVQTTALNKTAVELLMHTFVRQGEMRRGKWANIDFDKAEWRIPAGDMKMKQEHVVPLSSQMIAMLKRLKILTAGSEYLFPSQNRQKNPFMSENTVNKVIHDMGFKGQLVGHGFRAMASTILNENGFPPDVIERQLAHAPRNKVRAAYNRALYMEKRRKMMQWWSDYLTKAANG